MVQGSAATGTTRIEHGSGSNGRRHHRVSTSQPSFCTADPRRRYADWPRGLADKICSTTCCTWVGSRSSRTNRRCSLLRRRSDLNFAVKGLTSATTLNTNFYLPEVTKREPPGLPRVFAATIRKALIYQKSPLSIISYHSDPKVGIYGDSVLAFGASAIATFSSETAYVLGLFAYLLLDAAVRRLVALLAVIALLFSYVIYQAICVGAATAARLERDSQTVRRSRPLH
jgi:hypothetical protein